MAKCEDSWKNSHEPLVVFFGSNARITYINIFGLKSTKCIHAIVVDLARFIVFRSLSISSSSCLNARDDLQRDVQFFVKSDSTAFALLHIEYF